MPSPESTPISCTPLPLKSVLRSAGLRPTKQRIALAGLLRDAGSVHVTAESVFALALARGVSVSLATVYNTLHQFCEAGLLRKILVSGQRVYFDTNVADHHHFAVEDRIIDIPENAFGCISIPDPPAGHVITSIDIMVRLRRSRDR